MMNPVDASVSVDLSHVNAGALELACRLLFDHNDQPVELEIDLSDAGPQGPQDIIVRCGEVLQGRPVTVSLPDGRKLHTTIEVVSSIGTNSDGDAVARCLLGGASSGPSLSLDRQGTSWLFRLSNVKIAVGDHKTEVPAPPGAPAHLKGWKLDTIRFSAAGREWELRDEMFGKWKDRRPRDIQVPIVTATLSTAAQQNDTVDSISAVADTIASLLSLALARSVRCVTVQQVAANGSIVQTIWPNPMVYPFSKSGFSAVDNWEIGVLKGFIESAYPVVAADREWWHRTLDMHMQVHVNPYVEIKTMILNILADRIVAKLSVTDGRPEIGPSLNRKMDSDDFLSKLHDLFADLSDAWTMVRTEALISTVKGWNAKPSFVEGVRRACKAVGLRPPPGKLLSTRHALLHVGELRPPGATSDEYWIELDAMVLKLILRLLKYDGLAYWQALGPHPVKLRDYLEADMGDK